MNEVLHMKDGKRWRDSAPSMLSVNSIFAAVAVALLVVVLQSDKTGGLITVAVGLLAAATLLFALTAEKITEALDDDDVYKHVAYMFP
jgi:hypothetical protein